MAKTLVALNDNSSFNENMFEVLESLIRSVRNELFIGLVVKGLSYRSHLSSYIEDRAFKGLAPDSGYFWGETDDPKFEIANLFESTASARGLNFKIHNGLEVSSYELLKQSIYADLLILSYKVFFDPETNKPDNSFIYHILKGCRCPVFIMPENLAQIDSIIFTYDGKESSVFAIRAFSNLFSETLRDKEVTVLTVMPSAEEEIKNEKYLLDLVKQHYHNVGVQLLEGTNISEEIIQFAESQENALVVMGAYGRSRISNLFLPSVAKTILNRSKIPLFIAHR